MSFNVKQITKCDLTELLIKLIDGNNILECCSIQIVFCCAVFQQILIAGNQCKITVAVQDSLCAIFVGDYKVFIPKFLNLLVVSHKWLWHIITSE